MKDSVTKFCLLNEVHLPFKTAEDFRMLPDGTYTHRTLPFGSARLGITNGLVAFVLFNTGLQYVQFSNLNIVLDKKVGVTKQLSPRRERKLRTESLLDCLV